MIQEDVLQAFPELFGTTIVNGHEIDVQDTIDSLTRELRPAIAAALSARRRALDSAEPVRRQCGWPNWSDTFEDPVTGQRWTYRQIVQGMVDNFLDRDSPWRWRLNDEVPVPVDASPLANPGLELTGPWHPLDMAFNALNSPASVNMADWEDASPSHFRPFGTSADAPIGVFAALQNAMEILEGRWDDRPYELFKKNAKRAYRLEKPPSLWPTRFCRPPSIHVTFDHVRVDGEPAPGLVAVATLWTLNTYDALTHLGTGVYFYIPKMQTPQEAFIVETLLSRLETLIGVPAGTIKIKVLYEEGNGGRFLPALAWVFRRRLLGTNVGRWDYLGSLIEMWKDDPGGIFPDPQTIGMASPTMIEYQRYNALVMLMAGMKHGELTQAAPIGGMAAVMIYQPGDVYRRYRYNPVALRGIATDKIRERLLGLVFVPDQLIAAGEQVTLDDIVAGRITGTLYDTYRQSWVASPEPAYVAAGNVPLRIPVDGLQAALDAPLETTDVNGTPVPTAASGLSDPERSLLHARGVLNAHGKITPRVVERSALDAPEKIFTEALWESIYSVPEGEVTIEHIQHAFYMAANYGFQILNGNFAAAIDDYELKQRFMNDLATYRIDVSWLWTLVHHQAVITKSGWFRRQTLTEDGVELALPAEKVEAGTRFTRGLFDRVWTYHNEWTDAFFAELDRRGDPGRFDRSKAPVIMELLKRQLLSPRYIQHSARVLFLIAPASPTDRAEILDAIFDLSREEIVERVHAGTLNPLALTAHDYVYDVFAASPVEGDRTATDAVGESA